MKIEQDARLMHSGFWFSSFGQGYFFSAGYFAVLGQNSIRTDCLEDLRK